MILLIMTIIRLECKVEDTRRQVEDTTQRWND